MTKQLYAIMHATVCDFVSSDALCTNYNVVQSIGLFTEIQSSMHNALKIVFIIDFKTLVSI